MNREIKFRAWDKTLEEHLSNVQNHIGGGEWAFGNMLNDERYIVEQYTGLKDKNGTEIYESDLVRTTTKSGNMNGKPLRGQAPGVGVTREVYFHEGAFKYKAGRRGQPYHLTGAAIKQYGIEVIGNIHEHPHLLEKEPA